MEVIRTYWLWLLFVLLGFLILSVLSLGIIQLNKQLREKQKLLRKNEAHARATFEQAAVGIAHASPYGDILSANRKYCEITGYTEYELKKLNFNDLIQSDELSSEIELFDRLRQGKVDHFTRQQQCRRKDGNRAWVLTTVSAVRDEHGDLDFLVAVADDISKLKQLEHDVVQQQHQKNMILEMAGDGILGLDTEGHHTFVNPAAAEMLGYKVDEMLGKPSHPMWHHSYPDGKHFPESDCPITSVLQTGEMRRGINQYFWRKDGSVFPVEFISNPLIEDDKVIGAVVIFRALDNSSSRQDGQS
jgi:PAS domain S-box-containing protein